MLQYNVEIPASRIIGRELGGRNIDEVRAFFDSGEQTAELLPAPGDGRSLNSRNAGYYNAARRSGLPVKVVRRGERLFLIRI